MTVVSSARRQKSWQIADEIASLLDAVNLEHEQFAARLRALARARGLSSDEDAARLIGVSYRQYQRWLAGDSEARGSNLKRIAEAFDVPVAELLGQPDPSQLDRIEAMLERLLAHVEVSPAARSEADAELAGDVVHQLEEAAESTPKKAPGQPGSGRGGSRRKRA